MGHVDSEPHNLDLDHPVVFRSLFGRATRQPFRSKVASECRRSLRARAAHRAAALTFRTLIEKRENAR